MKNQLNKRAELIQQILDEYFPSPSVPLVHTSPFTLLIAVLLSARCTDKRVNEVTPELFSLASTPEEMAKIPVEQVQRIIRRCGLSARKARAIVELSKILVEKYQGVVPQNIEDLETLPGVGHKTASVVMVQAFGQSAFPVDTHIHRLAKRWGLTKYKSVGSTERVLKALFAEERWGILHLQLIWFGRTFCRAQGHQPDLCPICSRLFPKDKKA